MIKQTKKKVVLHEEVNFDEMIIPEAVNKSKGRNEKNSINIVLKGQIARVEMGKIFLMNLDFPDEIQIGFQKKWLFIGVEETFEGEFYNIKYGNKKRNKIYSKGNIYNKALIEEIIEVYGLDFEDGTSMSFNKVRYIEKDGEIQGALVRMKQSKEE